MNEAAFRETAKDWLNDVRRAFNLPPILTGDSDDYARAVADVARLLAEEHVFQPERILFDYAINHQLFPRLGFRHWLFKTGGAHISNEDAVVALLTLAHQASAMSSEEIREFVTTKLGKKLPAIGLPWAQRPSALNGALAAQGIDPGVVPEQPPGAAGTATTPPEDPDDAPAEVPEGSGQPPVDAAAETPEPVQGGSDKAEVEAEQAQAAADSADGAAAPSRRAEAVVGHVVVDAELLRTADGLRRLGDAVVEALRLKEAAEKKGAWPTSLDEVHAARGAELRTLYLAVMGRATSSKDSTRLRKQILARVAEQGAPEGQEEPTRVLESSSQEPAADACEESPAEPDQEGDTDEDEPKPAASWDRYRDRVTKLAEAAQGEQRAALRATVEGHAETIRALLGALA